MAAWAMTLLAALRWETPAPGQTPHADLAGLLACAGVDPPPTAAALERQERERPTRGFHHLTLARSASTLVGMARLEVPRSHERPGWFGVALEVDPAWQETGLTARLWQRAQAALPPQLPRRVLTTALEHSWQETFFRERGFAEQERMWSSTLDLRAFDPSRHAQRAERARDAGLRVEPLDRAADLKDQAQQRRLYALMVGLLADVPFGEPIAPWPFEVWRARILDDPDFDPVGVFLLLTPAGEWAGVSELYRLELGQPRTLHQGLTGVKAEQRGLGAAWLLKLTAAGRARERGFQFVKTSNHTRNAAMLAVNEGMGFVRGRATVTLLRREENP